MNLTNVAVNDNNPPHERLLDNGSGNYSADNATIAVTNFTLIDHLPAKGETYFLSGMDGNTIHSFDGTVHSSLPTVVMFSNVTTA